MLHIFFEKKCFVLLFVTNLSCYFEGFLVLIFVVFFVTKCFIAKMWVTIFCCWIFGYAALPLRSCWCVIYNPPDRNHNQNRIWKSKSKLKIQIEIWNRNRLAVVSCAELLSRSCLRQLQPFRVLAAFCTCCLILFLKFHFSIGWGLGLRCGMAVWLSTGEWNCGRGPSPGQLNFKRPCHHTVKTTIPRKKIRGRSGGRQPPC